LKYVENFAAVDPGVVNFWLVDETTSWVQIPERSRTEDSPYV